MSPPNKKKIRAKNSNLDHKEKLFNAFLDGCLFPQTTSALLFLISGCLVGLPDGFFTDQKYHFGKIREDLGIENVV
jgi:hypothetical protein